MKLKLKSIHSPLLFGIYAALTAIPLFIIFSLSASAIVIFIISLFGYPQAPTWLLITLLPLLLNPTMGILGIVYGIIKIRTRYAWLGIVFSLVCLAENALLLQLMLYIGKF